MRRTKSLLTLPSSRSEGSSKSGWKCWSGSTLGGWCTKTLSVREHQMLRKYSRNRSWPPNNACQLLPLKGFGRLLRLGEKKVFLAAPPCLLWIFGWNDLKKEKTNKELDEFYILCARRPWMIYERSTAHRAFAECKGLIHSVAMEGTYGHWTVKWDPRCKLLLKNLTF